MHRDYKNFDQEILSKELAKACPRKRYITMPVLKRTSYGC